MIIENVESLKTWLTNKLSPICDAEPIALAKYVCALLKKNKPEQDLKDICVDQLDVFLQQKTKSFVDELFVTLHAKTYITADTEIKAKPVPLTVIKNEKSLTTDKDKDGQRKKPPTDVSSTTDEKDNKDNNVALTTQASTNPTTTTTSAHKDVVKDSSKETKENSAPQSRDRERERDRDTSRDRRDSWKDERGRNDERNKVDDRSKTDDKRPDNIRDARDIIRERGENRDRGLDTREVRELHRDVRDNRDRDRDPRRRRTRSRSISPRRREFEDRRRRYDERPRFSPDRRWGRRRSWSRSPRRTGNRSPLDRVDRGPRPRSRSPRLRSRSPRFRALRSRSRSPRRARSWSRPTSPNHYRSPLSPSHVGQPDSRGSTPTQDNNYSTLISSSTNDLPAVTSTVGLRPVVDDGRLLPLTEDVRHVPASVTVGGKARCQNFEEKGYCVLGDLCPYDHGTDPVVVEDVSLQGGLSTSSASGSTIGGAGFITPDLRVPPPGLHMIGAPPQVEPYMPEAPGMQAPPRGFMRGPPPLLHQPPPGVYVRGPPPFMQRREVIMSRPPPPGIDEEDLFDLATDKESSRIVIPSKRPYSAIDTGPDVMGLGPPPPRMAHINQNFFGGPPPPMQHPMQHQQFPTPMGGPPTKRPFDFNRLGGRGGFRNKGPRPPFKTGNLTLEVRKIPAENNNIAKLNEHFGKFGTLTNIQVKYQGDTGAALISFSNNGEATAAYKSPEPVFNNRFIKLFWHNPQSGAEFDMEKDVGGAGATDTEVIQTTTVTGGRVGDGIDHPSLMLPIRSTIPPAHKLQLVNKPKPEPITTTATTSDTSTAPNTAAEKSIVYTSSVGNLKKTVFNTAATPTTPLSPPVKKENAPFISPTATKTADYVSRMEAIKRIEAEKKVAAVKQAELDLKRQELLAKQIQQQKILLETLEKKKATMSETEKKSLLQALRAISDAIDKVKYGTGTKNTPQQQQQPSAGQFRYRSQEQTRKDQQEQEQADVFTKQNNRVDDISALRAASAAYGRGRGWSGGRGGWRGARGRGGPMIGRTHLDNRPKTLEVKGFELHELEEVKAHFQKFGEMDKTEVDETGPSVFLTFSSRPAAEMALIHGSKFKQLSLVVRWNQFTPKIRSDSIVSSELDEDLTITLGSLDDESLLGMSSDKTVSVTPTMTSTVTKDITPISDIKLETDDSRSVVKEELPSDVTEDKTVTFTRSLSDELLMGDEHFKASYSEDEDDNITVTVSNTVGAFTGDIRTTHQTEDTADTPVDEEEDLADLENTALDYTEDEGAWS